MVSTVVRILIINFKLYSADFIDGGYHHTCALLESSSGNTARCWGSNTYGQLGYEDSDQRLVPDSSPIDLGSNFSVKQLSTSFGGSYTCVLSENNEAKCFGTNSYRQLGYGDTTPRGKAANSMGDDLPVLNFSNNFIPMSIECGGYGHSCALSTNGSVRCWGSAWYGQLGYEDSNDQFSPPSTNIDLGTGFKAIKIALGQRHTCVASDKGRMKCFGENDRGELGTGDALWRGKTSGTMGDNLGDIDLGSGFNVTQICCGNMFTCAVSEDSRVKCFGYNAYGQLGAGDTVDRGQSPDSMGDNLAAVDLGPGFLAQDVDCGYYHVCALSRDRRVACWGRNNYGQLGLGDTEHRGDEHGEMGSNLTVVNLGTAFVPVQIGLGYWHTCATSMDGTFKCFGYNAYGQLGDGDIFNIGNGRNEMGANLSVIDMGPTVNPTNLPSQSPSTQSPSVFPTRTRSLSPSYAPTRSPSNTPSDQPSASPSNQPSTTPITTSLPSTSRPTIAPTASPTYEEGPIETTRTTEASKEDPDDATAETSSVSGSMYLIILVILATGICFGFVMAALCSFRFWKRRKISDARTRIETVEMMISSQSGHRPQVQEVDDEAGEAGDVMDGIVGNDEGYEPQTAGAPMQRDEFEVFDDDEYATKGYRISTATTLTQQREGRMLSDRDAIDEQADEDELQKCVATATVRDITKGAMQTNDGGIIDESELDSIQSWLRETVHLEQYWDNFAVNGYDSLQRIKSIVSADELAEIGIVNKEHQKRILQAIQQI